MGFRPTHEEGPVGQETRLVGFPPLADPGARILVLGSFPSVASLGKGEYYGNPRNQFWVLVGRATGTKVPDGYESRGAWLSALGIAVWDVIGSCERPGSLDRAIRDARPNDVAAFLRSHPSVIRVVLNGSKAAREYGLLGPLPVPEAIAVPSSSPVPSRRYRTMEDKLPPWMAALSLPDLPATTSVDPGPTPRTRSSP